MLNRTSILATTAIVGVAFIGTMQSAEADWRDDYDRLVFGVTVSEGEEERRARYQAAMDYLSDEIGVPVELIVTGDYASNIESLNSGHTHISNMGAMSVAVAHEVMDGAIDVIASTLDSEGDFGYNSTIVVSADSEFEDIYDLEGHSLVFADPNSTSGYLVPSYYLRQEFGDIEEFFSETGFSGGHNNSVLAVVNGTYDAAAVHRRGEEGRSVPQRMHDAGLIDQSSVRFIWDSPTIPSSATLMHADLPEDLKDAIREAYLAMPERAPEAFAELTDGLSAGLVPVTLDDYQSIVDMRQEEQRMRRQ